MLSIRVARFAGQLFVGGEDRLKGIEDVFAGLLSGAALAQGAWYLEDAREDPTVLVGTVECDREVD